MSLLVSYKPATTVVAEIDQMFLLEDVTDIGIASPN